MRLLRTAAVVVSALALNACSSTPKVSSDTECHDSAKGHNCITITTTPGSDKHRVTDTWVYSPDAPVVEGLAPVHRSEWVATIDCETRGSQFEQARFWDAQDHEMTLGPADDATVRQTLTATAIPPLVTAICN